MNGGSAFSPASIEKIVGNNFNYWQLCIEGSKRKIFVVFFSGDETEILISKE